MARSKLHFDVYARTRHAYARGARLQVLEEQPFTKPRRSKWIEVGPVAFTLYEAKPHTVRIHPNDTYLQYGPIATLLQHRAFEDTVDSSLSDADWYLTHYATLYAIHEYTSREERQELYDLVPNEQDGVNGLRAMFLLFAAEALADEGF